MHPLLRSFVGTDEGPPFILSLSCLDGDANPVERPNFGVTFFKRHLRRLASMSICPKDIVEMRDIGSSLRWSDDIEDFPAIPARIAADRS
jgi:hypothetical protein